ncbi:adhesion G protein-coupled receptor G3-like isoform X2 [Sardina pilchardus]|uniref:adhesion G protein-coupled receptor G3-like isoform X2 n=1 Tax=Sardina pilchardus TaxID=27697 RepID=UPI002E0D6873
MSSIFLFSLLDMKDCTSAFENLWIFNVDLSKHDHEVLTCEDGHRCTHAPFEVKKHNGEYNLIFNGTLSPTYNISLWIMQNWMCKPSEGCNTTSLDNGAADIIIDPSVCGHFSKYDEAICTDLDTNGPFFILKTNMSNEQDVDCVTCNNPLHLIEEIVEVHQDLGSEGHVDAALANTFVESMKSVLDKLHNKSSVKVKAAGEVTGALLRLKETKSISVAYSAKGKEMVLVSNPNALQTPLSWSVEIPAEAVRISQSANDGEGFAGVLRFPNMSMDDKNSTVFGAVYGISMSANISNLTDPISIHFENVATNFASFNCTSWNGIGDKPNWTEDGCEMVLGNSNITCKCYHLTFFAILMNPLPDNNTLTESDLSSLTYISYIGCGLSIFFLGVALFMHYLLRKAKSSQAIQILMNLFTALFLLNLTFLSNESVANMGSNIGCIAIATLMHYSMLSTFTWFALQALHLYLRLVRMSNTKDVKNYMLKMCIPAWVCPAVVVITLAALNKYTLVTIKTSSGFQSKTCWITDTMVHYVVNIGYYAMVFLFTLGIFCVVVQRILMSNKLMVKDAKTPSVSKNLMAIMSLLALLGLTWGVAFFSYGDMMIPSYYIFCVLNAFQGFFLFIYYYNNSKDLGEDSKADNPFSSSSSSNTAISNTYVTHG